MKITIELNDREAMKVGMVKNILGCDTQTAVSLIIAACKRRTLDRAALKLPENEPEVERPLD